MNAPTLPHLGDDRITAMENTVFSRIDDERRRRRVRRTRGWAGAGVAAGVLVVAAVIAPSVVSTVTVSGAGGEAGGMPAPVVLREGTVESFSGDVDGAALPGGAADAAAPEASAAREIVATGSAAVTVDDVPDAAQAIASDAEARGGYVESVSIGGSGTVPIDGYGEVAVSPGYTGDGWVTVRVPADELTATIAALGEVGEVTSSNVSRQDVTDQAVDLRARIAASETSVARLLELMTQAQSTADLLAAESALAERQAALDADRQQLTLLESQVSLSSLSVQLSEETPPVSADPAGFGDGVSAGWNGLVATLNGIVVALGFLLPWLAVLGVAAAIAWAVVRLVRGRRARTPRDGAVPPRDGAAGEH